MGDLIRIEANNLVVGYSFDLKTNDLSPKTIKNPAAGKRHLFRAWRLKGAKPDAATMRSLEAVKRDLELEVEEEEE